MFLRRKVLVKRTLRTPRRFRICSGRTGHFGARTLGIPIRGVILTVELVHPFQIV